MELLEISDTHLTKYDVSYDPTLMKEFLQTVIKDYSEFETLQRKVKNESEILSRYTQYDICKDLKLIKECKDNTKIHVGRKRIARKEQPKKYLYSFTAVTYPEIYYAINNFLNSKTADFGVFNIFIDPSNYVSYNYPLEPVYNPLDLMDYRLLYDNRKQVDLLNNELTRKLNDQGNCLKEFLNLLTFTVVEQREINNYETLNMLRRLLHNQFMAISMAYINTFIDPTNNAIDEMLDNALTYKEVKQARENYVTIEKIKKLSKDKVKSL